MGAVWFWLRQGSAGATRGRSASPKAAAAQHQREPDLSAAPYAPAHRAEDGVERTPGQRWAERILALMHAQALTRACGAAQALPAAITALTSLTLLSMAQNRLASLPDSLPLHLTSLVTLQLASNLLDSLPASFSALTCLSLLDLSKNRLASAPPCLRPLSAMNRLVLAGNPPLIASRLPLPAWLLRRPGVLVEHRVSRPRRTGPGTNRQRLYPPRACLHGRGV